MIPEDARTLLIYNRGTASELYLWDDGEKISEIGDLPEFKKQLVGAIIMAVEKLQT